MDGCRQARPCERRLPGALDSFSWAVLGWAETVTAGAFTRMHIEEYVLKRKYPEYREYKKRAKKLIPFVY